MRRKIAKRLRREILRLGATIEEEEWLGDKKEPRKERGFAVTVKYKGGTICSPDYDELEAYRITLYCIRHWDEIVKETEEKREKAGTPPENL